MQLRTMREAQNVNTKVVILSLLLLAAIFSLV